MPRKKKTTADPTPAPPDLAPNDEPDDPRETIPDLSLMFFHYGPSPNDLEGLPRLADIPPLALADDPRNPRTNLGEDFAELVDSIRASGVTRVLEAYWLPTGGLQLHRGHRRKAAALEAGLATVPVLVKAYPENQVARTTGQVLDNLHAAEMDPIALARLLDEELDAATVDEEGNTLTQTALARRLGWSQPKLSNLIRLLELPVAVQKWLHDGRISQAHGVVLLGVKYPTMKMYGGWDILETVEQVQIRLADEVVAQGASSKSLANVVSRHNSDQKDRRGWKEQEEKRNAATVAEAKAKAARAASGEPEAPAALSPYEADYQAWNERARTEAPQRQALAREVVHNQLRATGGQVPTGILRAAVVSLVEQLQYALREQKIDTKSTMQDLEAAGEDPDNILEVLRKIVEARALTFVPSYSYETWVTTSGIMSESAYYGGSGLRLREAIAEALEAAGLTLPPQPRRADYELSGPPAPASSDDDDGADVANPTRDPATMPLDGMIDPGLTCLHCTQTGQVRRAGLRTVCTNCDTTGDLASADLIAVDTSAWTPAHFADAEAEDDILEQRRQAEDATAPPRDLVGVASTGTTALPDEPPF